MIWCSGFGMVKLESHMEANVGLHRWSVGSLMFLASFAAVMGPMNYVYHLFSTPRLPFTAAYFGSITLTLVFALKVSFALS